MTIMTFFEVITTCPLHKKNVYIRVEADNALAATKKAVGMIIDCPHGPTNALGHSFIVGFREGEKEILGATPLPWMPSSIVSSAPGLTPLTPVTPTP